MKHPLSGLHLEGHCSTELGEHHLFTVNMNRVNTGVWVDLVFFSQECILGKKYYRLKPKDNIKPFWDRKYLVTCIYQTSCCSALSIMLHCLTAQLAGGWNWKSFSFAQFPCKQQKNSVDMPDFTGKVCCEHARSVSSGLKKRNVIWIPTEINQDTFNFSFIQSLLW